MIIRSHTYVAIPPGETIKEQMEMRGVNKQKLMKILAMSSKQTDKLLDGDTAITPDIAEKLERVLTVPKYIWLRYEDSYRFKIKLVNAENNAEKLNKLFA